MPRRIPAHAGSLYRVQSETPYTSTTCHPRREGIVLAQPQSIRRGQIVLFIKLQGVAMGKLGGEMKALAKKAGGSYKTVDDRIHIVQRFSRHLRSLNIQIQRVEQIKVRHIECYIQARLAQEIGKRTLQNEMAALRGVLQQAGRKQVAEHERLTNKSLGLAGASRNGTKGHRPRENVIQDTGAVKNALENALTVAEERNGRLIDRPNLQKAMNYWRGEIAKAGLTGDYTPHSLRYAWTQDALRHYLAQGFSDKEVLALAAMDLGHGDGRGRYVVQVYGRREEE